jgi:hypothetical protein
VGERRQRSTNSGGAPAPDRPGTPTHRIVVAGNANDNQPSPARRAARIIAVVAAALAVIWVVGRLIR